MAFLPPPSPMPVGSCAGNALAVLFAAFLVFFEIRHAMNGGDPFAPASGLVEQGLMTVSAFGFAFVLTRLDAARANVVFRWAVTTYPYC